MTLDQPFFQPDLPQKIERIKKGGKYHVSFLGEEVGVMGRVTSASPWAGVSPGSEF